MGEFLNHTFLNQQVLLLTAFPCDPLGIWHIAQHVLILASRIGWWRGCAGAGGRVIVSKVVSTNPLS